MRGLYRPGQAKEDLRQMLLDHLQIFRRGRRAPDVLDFYAYEYGLPNGLIDMLLRNPKSVPKVNLGLDIPEDTLGDWSAHNQDYIRKEFAAFKYYLVCNPTLGTSLMEAGLPCLLAGSLTD